MAHTLSAKKRIRQNEKREAENRARRSRVRTFVRQVEEAIQSGDRQNAEAAFRLAMPELHRGVTKGVIAQNTASRKISRLNTRIKAL